MGILICGRQPEITFSNILGKTTRSCKWHRLVVFTFLLACSPGGHDKQLSINWNNNKATSLLIPLKLVPGATADSIGHWLKVVISDDSNAIAILGDYKLDDDLTFEPLVPFSRGLSYGVFYLHKKIGDFQIPAADPKHGPLVTAVYPGQDTLPQNLLKFYIRFSQSMSEGESGKHIILIKNGTDTLRNVFLDLQPELWNAERTVITMWLDPGRIKRGLQPNEGMGAPLEENAAYTLRVEAGWKDTQGRSLQQAFSKSFVAAKRDSLSPDPAQWTLQIPKVGSGETLNIDCKEPLDYFLLAESLRIVGPDGSDVKGNVAIMEDERTVRFTPARAWVKGEYILVVQSILEDLAGNNINRPFDRDIYLNKAPKSDAFYTLSFRISD